MARSPHASGQAAEQQALNYLQRQGLRPLQRNWRTRQGELDLIMQAADDTLVFIEVRLRSRSHWGSARESVDTRKRQRLIRTAQAFLQQYPQLARYPCRFDVIAFEPDGTDTLQLDWIRDAFTA